MVLTPADEVISTKTIFHNLFLDIRQSYPTNILKDNSMITMMGKLLKLMEKLLMMLFVKKELKKLLQNYQIIHYGNLMEGLLKLIH